MDGMNQSHPGNWWKRSKQAPGRKRMKLGVCEVASIAVEAAEKPSRSRVVLSTDISTSQFSMTNTTQSTRRRIASKIKVESPT